MKSLILKHFLAWFHCERQAGNERARLGMLLVNVCNRYGWQTLAKQQLVRYAQQQASCWASKRCSNTHVHTRAGHGGSWWCSWMIELPRPQREWRHQATIHTNQVFIFNSIVFSIIPILFWGSGILFEKFKGRIFTGSKYKNCGTLTGHLITKYM